MKPRLKRLLVQGGSLLLAVLLLYLALRGVDLEEVGQALAVADYRWLPALVVVALLSHGVRAYRWKILLDALPGDARVPDAEHAQDDEGPIAVSLRTAFYSIMIGYMVNYAAPRLGEVARTANTARQERIRFSSVFGTVVADRLLDMAVLGVALLTVPFFLMDQRATLERLFLAPMATRLEAVPLGWLLLVGGGLLVLGGLAVYLLFGRPRAPGRKLWAARVAPLLVSFRGGLWTILRSRRRLALVLSTAAMWGAYLMMAHLPFLMLDMAEPFALSLADTWVIMLLGAIGVVIPSPGGVGSYHFITIQTLVHLFAVDAAPAATYAVLAHAAQLVLYVALGAACLLLQGSSLRGLTEEPAPAPDPPTPS